MAVWNAATQDCWAASCEEAPVASMVPERVDSLGASVVPPVPPSFAAQPARARAATAPTAPIRAIREIFTVDPSIFDVVGPGAGHTVTLCAAVNETLPRR